MPDFLEKRLGEEADKKGFSGKRKGRYVFGAMQNMGAMIGNRISAKGKRMEAKHEAKISSRSTAKGK
jgi:hypothetical protein